MHRSALRETLYLYSQTWPQHEARCVSWDVQTERKSVQDLETFIENNAACFERSNAAGHMTGSALVTNSTLDRVLLTHHKKLNMWLQLGGHADGCPYLDEVAMTEAREESGLNRLHFLDFRVVFAPAQANRPLPFDIDKHLIPENKKEGSHLHFDLRYLIVADDCEAHVVSEESHDIRWFDLTAARRVTSEPSMLRQFDKLALIRDILSRGRAQGQ